MKQWPITRWVVLILAGILNGLVCSPLKDISIALYLSALFVVAIFISIAVTWLFEGADA